VVWPERETNIECTFDRLKAQKPVRYVGSIGNSSSFIEALKGMSLSWSVYMPESQAQRPLELSDSYQLQDAIAGRHLLAGRTNQRVTLESENASIGIEKVQLRAAKSVSRATTARRK
jgi:hypothetical protein